MKKVGVCSGSSAQLNPMVAMFGGIVGQEVVKACSGKLILFANFLTSIHGSLFPLKRLQQNI